MTCSSHSTNLNYKRRSWCLIKSKLSARRSSFRANLSWIKGQNRSISPSRSSARSGNNSQIKQRSWRLMPIGHNRIWASKIRGGKCLHIKACKERPVPYWALKMWSRLTSRSEIASCSLHIKAGILRRELQPWIFLAWGSCKMMSPLNRYTYSN